MLAANMCVPPDHYLRVNDRESNKSVGKIGA